MTLKSRIRIFNSQNDTLSDGQIPDGIKIPLGGTCLWFLSEVPKNFLELNGQSVSRTTYKTLFALLGTTYGSGDGSTTFNLPNLSGNVPVGYSSSDSTFGTIGGTGGAKTHTLTEAQMPQHRHSFTMKANNVNTAGGYPYDGTSAATATYTGYTNYTGGSASHNNLQPYIVMKYIMRAK